MNQPEPVRIIAKNFEDLSMTWKTLSVMGIIFTTICLVLLTIVILMFKTDLIAWPHIELPSEEELDDEFGDFLEEFENGPDLDDVLDDLTESEAKSENAVSESATTSEAKSETVLCLHNNIKNPMDLFKSASFFKV